MLGYPPPGKADPPPDKADTPPPGKQTPQRPWQGDPPTRRPPCPVHAGRYGQQAGGMHPTGMQFLYY